MEENVVEIEKGIYWVGGSGQDGGLHCNPYLIVDGDEAVLIDPGSVLDFEYVYENIRSIIPLSKVKYVVLHHQDPDFCASVPLFEKMGGRFQIVTQWRTQSLIKYYGVRSPYYIVDEHDNQLVLESGRVLKFVPTPYLHFPGSITTYDTKSGVLFSSDLFGAFSFHWSLYAKEGYIERMKTFHEHYMPSNAILRPVMEVFLGMDIRMIAPQHGSVIRGDVRPYIKALRDLECGTFLDPIRKELAKSGGYRSVFTRILKRYESVFSREDVLEVIDGLDMTVDQDLEVTDFSDRETSMWNMLFEAVLAKKGLAWLLVIEPLVNTISKEYDIPMPDVFNGQMKRNDEPAMKIRKENALLRELNSRLSKSLQEDEERAGEDQPHHILIVDHDAVHMDMLKFTLEHMGFRVTTAEDGEEALGYASANPPDLIISEAALPKMDGFRLKQTLDADPRMKDIPFLITALDRDEVSLSRAESLSILHYFQKPYMLSEMAGLVRNLFSGAKAI